MPCSCKNKKKPLSASARLISKLRVTCPDCTGNLIGIDGTEFPIHLTPVIVSAQQIQIWQSAGHNIIPA